MALTSVHVRAATLMFVMLSIGCLGPEAPDPAVCRDVIHRICIAPVCDPQVPPLFTPPTSNCEPTLLMKSGCGSEDFVFTSPTRERFLSCRLPLLRTSGNPEAHPDCLEVAETFDRCPDVVRMLQGIK